MKPKKKLHGLTGVGVGRVRRPDEY